MRCLHARLLPPASARPASHAASPLPPASARAAPHAASPLRAAPPRPSPPLAALPRDADPDVPIEGVARGGPDGGGVCDDTVCTVSPAVESTAKSLVRAVARGGAYAPSRFQPDVLYADPVRTFRGVDGYERLTWIADLVADPAIAVTRARFDDAATLTVAWTLRGTVRGAPLDADVASVFVLDQLTGRVSRHSETWTLDRTPLPARLAATAARAAWAAARAGEDAARGGAALLDSLASTDGEDEFVARPDDPTRFFQSGDDDTMRDAFAFAAGLAVFWVLVQAWGQLEGVKF